MCFSIPHWITILKRIIGLLLFLSKNILVNYSWKHSWSKPVLLDHLSNMKGQLCLIFLCVHVCAGLWCVLCHLLPGSVPQSSSGPKHIPEPLCDCWQRWAVSLPGESVLETLCKIPLGYYLIKEIFRLAEPLVFLSFCVTFWIMGNPQY